MYLLLCSFSALHVALKKASSLNKDRVGLTNEALLEDGGERGEGGHEGEHLAQRRSKLPCPTPEMADFSLWSILRKNIGTWFDSGLTEYIVLCQCTLFTKWLLGCF